MKEDESNWFSKWEEELPSPEELMPLSQTLITHDLALAFDIRNPSAAVAVAGGGANAGASMNAPPPPSSLPLGSSELAADSGELGSGGTGGDEPARTLKRPRLVWTPQLHKRFVDAVAHLGIKNAVPKTIMQLMSVDGLTRENVASHLQKYRLYLKRMQGLNSGSGCNAAALGGPGSDAATDHLFASSPVPPQFLHPGRPNSHDHFFPYMPVVALQQHHHQATASVANPQLQGQFNRQMGHFGSTPNGGLEHSLLARQAQHQTAHRMGVPALGHSHPIAGLSPNLDSPNGNSGRKVLTLFPTGED